MSLPSIWLIGDWGAPAFDEPVAWIRASTNCRCFASPAAACAEGLAATSTHEPQSIVLLQARPGEVSAEQVEKLHAREPLARLILLTGPWCEGEQRSGRPVAGVSRVAW